MLIIPAIDIIKGRVIRLEQGDFTRETYYSDDPLQTALNWQKQGARFLHLVDLDGAKNGKLSNTEVITSIIKAVTIPCEVGGGLRKESDIEYYLRAGASRVVIGTKAIEDESFLQMLLEKFKEKIVVSIDSYKGYVSKAGWLEPTNLVPEIFAKRMQDMGVKTLIVTDIALDGTLKGPNIEMLEKILRAVDISVIASGGISNLGDIKNLKAIATDNLEGVIIGRALYEGTINLGEAIQIAGC